MSNTKLANKVKPGVWLGACALAAAMACVCTSAGAQSASAPANEASQKMVAYEEAAAKLSAGDIYKELERLRTVQGLKMQKPNASIWAMDDDTFKATGYATALDKRHKAGEPEAAFYYALHNARLCGGLQSVGGGISAQMVQDCWTTTLEGFKVASTAQIPAASANVAKMYEGGMGVPASKLVAAEWFLKAAEQYNKAGSRDEALTALESALTMAPDLPAALRMKQAMLK